MNKGIIGIALLLIVGCSNDQSKITSSTPQRTVKTVAERHSFFPRYMTAVTSHGIYEVYDGVFVSSATVDPTLTFRAPR